MGASDFLGRPRVGRTDRPVDSTFDDNTRDCSRGSFREIDNDLPPFHHDVIRCIDDSILDIFRDWLHGKDGLFRACARVGHR
jgi:hypothetical protein